MSPKKNTSEMLNRIRQDFGLVGGNTPVSNASNLNNGVPTGFATNIKKIKEPTNTNQNRKNLNEKFSKLLHKKYISVQEMIEVNNEIKYVLQNIFDDFDLYIQKKSMRMKQLSKRLKEVI